MPSLSFESVPFERPFSLVDTLKSGQVFQWEPLTLEGVAGFAGCIGEGSPTWIAQPEPDIVLARKDDVPAVSRYFGLDQRLSDIHQTFPQGDPVLTRAIAYCPGIRVARQPIWECLATFITSSLKQVSHIRAISMTLRKRFGEEHELGGKIFHSYPTPAVMADAGEAELRACALGYRARSLALAGEAVAERRIDLERIEGASDPAEARAELLSLHGVGEKIANCVLLFSCGHWGAFPIDVWIEKVLRESYRKRLKGARLQQWAESYFGENAGYAQQYLFHHARKTM